MAEAEDPDEQLVSLSKDGNIDAFNSLVQRYEAPVYNLCYRLLGHRQAAEDATQEAFLSAYRSIARFSGGSFRSWVFRIAANESKDELRRRGRKDLATSLDGNSSGDDRTLDVPDEAVSVESSAETLELGALLQEALNSLPFDQRQAIVMVDYFGFRYEEAAQTLGASVGTIKSRIHRGRERLRDYIRQHPELFASYRR
jgi:RNA polymerase sigma-70 factor (ECF subfamily)